MTPHEAVCPVCDFTFQFPSRLKAHIYALMHMQDHPGHAVLVRRVN